MALSRSGTEAVSGPFDVTVTFNENVTGLTLAEVGVTGGTATGTFSSGAEDVFTVRITPAANAESVVVAIGASVAQDAAGNENTAATALTVPVASSQPMARGPSLTVTSPAVGSRLFNTSSVTVEGGCAAGGSSVTFSGDVTRATTSCSSQGAFRQALTFSSGNGDKWILISQENANGDSSGTYLRLRVDRTAPTVRLFSLEPGDVRGAFDVQVRFSENVTGFVLADDVTVTGGTATGQFTSHPGRCVHDACHSERKC